MVDCLKSKSVLLVSVTLSLFSIKVEAGRADFVDEAVVYTNAHYQTPSKEQSTREDTETPISVYVSSPGKTETPHMNSLIVKAHRTKVFTPPRSPSIISGQERVGLVSENVFPNDPNNEVEDPESMPGEEDHIFETIGYTREILGREIAAPAPMFEEMG